MFTFNRLLHFSANFMSDVSELHVCVTEANCIGALSLSFKVHPLLFFLFFNFIFFFTHLGNSRGAELLPCQQIHHV